MADTQPAAKRQKTEAVATRAITVSEALTEEVNDSIPAAPSTSKVFTVVEILENVLSNLDLVELTLVERVSSLWKTLIRNAPGLKEQRFLKAMPITSLLTLLAEPNVEKRFLKDKLFQPRLTYDQSALCGHAAVICSVHPCFASHGRSNDDDYVPNCILITIEDSMTAWRRSAPWEDMYLTQPPCKKTDVDIFLDSKYAIKDRNKSSSETRDDLATLGWIRDLMAKMEDILEPLSDYAEFHMHIYNHQADTDIAVKMAEKFAADYHPVVEDVIDPGTEDEASET